MQKINRVLLPNICFDEGGQTFAYNGKQSPLEQALEATDKSLYLVAAGGIGKTTSLRTFWLDYLQNRHNVPCVYVDLKRLDDRADNIERPIQSYLSSAYKLNFKEGFERPLLLLDGANEASGKFRSGGKDGATCILVKECGTLMREGWRITITSRSEQIGMETKVSEREFSDMLYGELAELTDEQLSTVTNLQIDASLSKLLHNNMMLSIFMTLTEYGIIIPPEKMKAGVLLKLYMDVCIRIRYIKNSKVIIDSEKDLYKCLLAHRYVEVIDAASESPDPADCIELSADMDAGCYQYEKIRAALLADPIGLSQITQVGPQIETLKHLALVEKVRGDTDQYIWTNEFYQEYFEAERLVKLLKSEQLQNDKFVGQLSHYRDKTKNSDGRKRNADKVFSDYDAQRSKYEHYYDTLQFAGEMGGFTAEELSRLYLLGGQGLQYHQIVMVLSVLAGFEMPQSAGTVPSYTFERCERLKEITIPDNIRRVEFAAFVACRNLEEVKNGTQVEHIDVAAYVGCNLLKRVDFGPKLKTIGANAFWGCWRLKSLTLGENIELIEPYAFLDCKGIEELKINSLYCKIEERAFCGCEAILELTLGPNVESVGDEAFIQCKSLKRVSIIGPENGQPKELGMDAFEDCTSLKEAYISRNVILGSHTFAGCMMLKDIYCEDEEQPESWSKDWLRGCNAKVHWRCKL